MTKWDCLCRTCCARPILPLTRTCRIQENHRAQQGTGYSLPIRRPLNHAFRYIPGPDEGPGYELAIEARVGEDQIAAFGRLYPPCSGNRAGLVEDPARACVKQDITHLG